MRAGSGVEDPGVTHQFCNNFTWLPHRQIHRAREYVGVIIRAIAAVINFINPADQKLSSCRENFPHALSVAHQMIMLPPRMRTANKSHA